MGFLAEILGGQLSAELLSHSKGGCDPKARKTVETCSFLVESSASLGARVRPGQLVGKGGLKGLMFFPWKSVG